jgi:hypothetical protein
LEAACAGFPELAGGADGVFIFAGFDFLAPAGKVEAKSSWGA